MLKIKFITKINNYFNESLFNEEFKDTNIKSLKSVFKKHLKKNYQFTLDKLEDSQYFRLILKDYNKKTFYEFIFIFSIQKEDELINNQRLINRVLSMEQNNKKEER